MASDVEQSKKQMRIALVGVRPADQVTLKGYLRVLLRLDVELSWVSATDSPIDLFMINEEFKGVASVTKLLHVHQGVPVLYVNRLEVGDGGINQNVLTLPLKQINLLNDWLVRHVAVLAGSLIPTSTNAYETTSDNKAPSDNGAEPKTVSSEAELGGLLGLVKELQSRPKQNFELFDGERVVAIVQADRQRVWIRAVSPTLSALWTLRPYTGQLPEATQSLDLVVWLWQMAWQNSDVVAGLIDDSKGYQIRYWVKPPMNDMRRNLLQIMTVIEPTALTVAQIASRASVSVSFAKKALAALLFSGALMDDVYKALKVPSQMPSVTPSVVEKAPDAPAPVATPQQEEKLGFLARLRKKLGL